MLGNLENSHCHPDGKTRKWEFRTFVCSKTQVLTLDPRRSPGSAGTCSGGRPRGEAGDLRAGHPPSPSPPMGGRTGSPQDVATKPDLQNLPDDVSTSKRSPGKPQGKEGDRLSLSELKEGGSASAERRPDVITSFALSPHTGRRVCDRAVRAEQRLKPTQR